MAVFALGLILMWSFNNVTQEYCGGVYNLKKKECFLLTAFFFLTERGIHYIATVCPPDLGYM